MNQVRAKFVCQNVTHHVGGQQNIVMTPVVGDNSEENKSFSKYTPNGKLELTITNEAVFDFFKPGKQFYLDMIPAE